MAISLKNLFKKKKQQDEQPSGVNVIDQLPQREVKVVEAPVKPVPKVTVTPAPVRQQPRVQVGDKQFSATGGTAQQILSPVERFAKTISWRESRNMGDYKAVNKNTGAMGRYQIMPQYLGYYSKNAIGREVSKDEFMNNPDLQDQIAKGNFLKMYEKYGNWEDVASMWHSGVPLKQAIAERRHDGNMSTKDYVLSVMAQMKNMGLQAELPEQKQVGIRDVLKEVPGAVQKTAATIVRAPVRAGLSTRLTLFNEPDYQPKTGLDKFLLGQEPVKNIRATGEDTITSFGGSQQTATKFGTPLGIALTALDLSPWGSGKKGLISDLAKESEVINVFKLLKKANVADDVAELYAPFIAKTSKEAEVKTILDKIIDISKGTERVKPVVNEAPLIQHDVYGLRAALNPINATDDVSRGIYQNWSRATKTAEELAQTEARGLADIPGKTGVFQRGGKQAGNEGWQVILDYEKGTPTPYSTKIASTFDKLYKEAVDRGLDVLYRRNYIPQMYKNTPEEVTAALAKFMKARGVSDNIIADFIAGRDIPENISKVLQLNPSFTKQRVFPDYATAIKYGLTPKYTHPAQLAAAYRLSMERAIANRELISNLTAANKLSSIRLNGYAIVDIPGLTKPMFAEKNLANALNGIFRDESNLTFGAKILSAGAKASRVMQELALSAGIPKTNVNFFSIGQLIKEITAGKFKSIPAFIRSNFNASAIKWFEAKAPVIKKMAEYGLDISDRVGTWRDTYKNMLAKPEYTKMFGKVFDKAFNEKTFASFMPQLYVNTFEATYKQALKRGLPEEMAAQLAADTTRNFHGLFEDTARSKTTQDALSTFFFAPKFREGIIRTLWNTARSVVDFRTWSNPAFRQNRKLAVGMALTYGAYQYLNMKLSGHPTWDNESGREFALRVPLGDNVMYVEFMPSFLSLPRNLAEGTIALAQLDINRARQEFSTLVSMPLQTANELIQNRDYFGREIVKDTDSSKEKIEKWAVYLGLQKTHPYLRLVADLVKPNENFPKPIYQSIAEAAEFPLKFNSLDRISRQEFYEAVDKKSKETADARRKVQPIYDNVQKLKAAGKIGEAQMIVNALSKEDYEVYKKIKAGDKRGDTIQTKSRVYQVFLKVQELKAEGKQSEALQLVNSLTNDEYNAYKLLKKQFGQ